MNIKPKTYFTGRNHGSCCTRRGVPPSCLSLCSGVIVDSLLVTATTCIPYIGNIALCFEEGTELLPPPISELHAAVVDDSTVMLEWEPPGEGNVTDYVIHYQKVDNTSMHEMRQKLENVSSFRRLHCEPEISLLFQQMNVSSTSAMITGLEKGSRYNMFVVARNEHGTSLPSSILMITVTKPGRSRGANNFVYIVYHL